MKVYNTYTSSGFRGARPKGSEPNAIENPVLAVIISTGLMSLLSLLLISGCAAPVQQSTPKEVDCLKAGLALQDAGNHLHAGYWFEAALVQYPDEEQRILRLLVEAQIRAGRLLAAQSGLARLKILSEKDTSISELAQAIQQKNYSQPPSEEMQP